MITMSGDNGPKEETCVNTMSLERSKILTKRGYNVLGSTSFEPSLIPKTDRGRTNYCIRQPGVPLRSFEPKCYRRKLHANYKCYRRVERSYKRNWKVKKESQWLGILSKPSCAHIIVLKRSK